MTKKKPPLVLLVGHRGNMGRRYAAILDYLEVSWIGTEHFQLHQHEVIQSRNMDDVYSHIIIATPTDAHDMILRLLHGYKGRVLCEKPLCKNDLIDNGTAHKIPLTSYWPEHLYMVNNYAHITEEFWKQRGLTSYHFYNTGNDGLLWDCLQLLVIARHGVEFGTKSPIWEVQINGTMVPHRAINMSYVSMIEEFLKYNFNREKFWHANDPRVLRAHAIASSFPSNLKSFECGHIDNWEIYL